MRERRGRSEPQEEKAARQFFHSFKKEYSRFRASLRGLASEEERDSYCRLLLHRILFSYFLQKQGLLAGDPQYLSTHLRASPMRDSFYQAWLLPLFHTHLSKLLYLDKKTSPLEPPALDLRLFHTQSYESEVAPIQIPDQAFSELFRFLDTYQWRLTGHSNYKKRELHPDLLADLLEQHLNQKQMGAYYTRQDVTLYIARCTIIGQLFQRIGDLNLAPWKLLQKQPERYIAHVQRQREYLPCESDLEYDKRQQRSQQLLDLLRQGQVESIEEMITHNLDLLNFALDLIASSTDVNTLLAMYHALEEMTILDPTCGSGAFLVAALDTLEPLYSACLTRMSVLARETVPPNAAVWSLLARVEQSPNPGYFVVESILSKNLYGVDIMEDAIDICKQRLYLRLLAWQESPGICPLPALDQHLKQGNTLVGFIQPPIDLSQLSKPGSQLDQQLASKYGIDASNNDVDYEKALSDWRSSHQPFHWCLEFPEVMRRGGFSVIIGNPPYVEYSKVRQAYSVHDYAHGSCGNIYAAVIERAFALCQPAESYFSLIVPLSICGGERFKALRQSIRHNAEQLWLANFEIFPSRLFPDAYQRLTILLGKHGHETQPEIHTTRIQRWYAPERSHLIPLISYTAATSASHAGAFPKLAAALQESILAKIHEKSEDATTIDSILQREQTEHYVFYQEATNYWTKATCRIPYYKKNGEITRPQHGRFLYFSDQRTARNVMLIMNSSLFYLWFASYGDGFHLAHSLVKAFPLRKALCTSTRLDELAQALEENVRLNARKSTRNTRTNTSAIHHIELEEYSMGNAKAILDEIDHVLAQCYGFSDEEYNFIIQYDIKYRMGRGNKRKGGHSP